MRLRKNIIVAGLLATFMITGLVACGDDGKRTKVVFTTGFASNEIFRIGTEVCTKEELMVYLTNLQNQYEQVYGKEIWNVSADGITLEENVKDTVLSKIAQIKTMSLLAEEKGIVLNEEESERVLQAADEYFHSLNETEVEQMGISYDMIKDLYWEYAMADKVYYQIIENINPEISDDEARIITVQHILLQTVKKDGEGNTVSCSDEEKKAAYDKMQEIRELVVSGTNDFEELASQYSDDATVTYSFGKGEMDERFEAAAFQLESDEISKVVESDIGYHIIKCMNTFNREETDANKLEIVEERRKEAFGQEYDTFVSGLARQMNTKAWDKVEMLQDENITTADFFEVYNKYFSESK